jgi:hypothetical protein
MQPAWLLQQPLLLLLQMTLLQMWSFHAGQIQTEAALETRKAEPALASPEHLSLLLGPLMSHHLLWVWVQPLLYQPLCLPLLPAALLDHFAEHVQLLVQRHPVSVWLSFAC